MALAVVGCDTDRDSDLSASIVLYDAGGDLVTSGELMFDAPPTNGATVSGTYRLSDSSSLALESSGALDAACGSGPPTDGQLVVRLGLEVADGGVYLIGTCQDGLGGGMWEMGTIAGPIPAGTFTID